MKKFLYLDNWHERQKPTRFDAYLAESGLDIDVKCTNEDEFDIDAADYCGVYVSPSFDGAYDDFPWIHQLHVELRTLARASLPMIGLCFGSQVLASALVGRDQVFIRQEREKGYGSIQLTDLAGNDVVMAGLPASFPVFHWHGDEVRAGHDEILVLADSQDCGNQIWRWSKGSVWGVQPHPEFDRQSLIGWFSNNRRQFEAGGLDHAGLVAAAHDSKEAFAILENFVAYVHKVSS